LGAVDDAGRVTIRGRAIAAVGTHPRLSRALLDGAGPVGAERAAQIVALLSDDTLTGGHDDLVAAWRRLRDRTDPAATARWRDEVRRLSASARLTSAGNRPAVDRLGIDRPGGDRLGGDRPGGDRLGGDRLGGDRPGGDRLGGDRPGGDRLGVDRSGVDRVGLSDDLAAGLVIGLAYPERLARSRQPGAASFLMAGGTAAELSPASALAGPAWLAIAAVDRAPGRPTGRVRLAAAIDEATAREAGAPLLSTQDEVSWSGGELVARRVERLGALVLTERRLAAPGRALISAALLDALRRDGLAGLDWSPAAQQLRDRLAFCHRTLGRPWPDVGDQALLARAPEWLGPELARARHRDDLRRANLGTALRRLLPGPQAARLDQVAPERLAVPSGSRVRVDYTDPDAPVLAVKVQEAFGWTAAPTIGDGRTTVLLHLLSPAGRPVAVTRDLASFWQTGYPRVRAELRGRYPRHPWPEDPTDAPPTRRPTPRRS
jgi:ATP-dependent helicase HrpB